MVCMVCMRRGKTKILDFFFIGASAIKSWEKLRIFSYGLPEDFLSKGQKPWVKGLTFIWRTHLFPIVPTMSANQVLSSVLKRLKLRRWAVRLCTWYAKPHSSVGFHEE